MPRMAGNSEARNVTNGNRPWILWLQDDLRLRAHPALSYAAARGPVLPVFIIDDDSPRRAPGAAARWWQRTSLAALEAEIAADGGRLTIRRGAAKAVLGDLVNETNAAGVSALRVYDAPGIKEQKQVGRALEDAVPFETHVGDVLIEPGEVLTKSDAPYRVFTPFWRALQEQIEDKGAIADKPKELSWYSGKVKSESSDAIAVPEEEFGWTEGLAESWQPGEQGARQLLRSFTSDVLATYEEDRNLPAVVGTSRLSPHLRFGEIGIREAWDAVTELRKDSPIAPNQCEAWLRELGWREFCRHLLFHFPDMETKNFRSEYDAFDWRRAPKQLRAWQRGRTGYPLVDAGMRELWHTGWMHNRVRMVVASFLTKHLRIHWRAGETWFWDTLVDADYANNPANWQWTAGTGADAAPYFRIFNPSSQAEKFDKAGDYIRRWLPEIAELPDKALRQPWLAGDMELEMADVTLGETYPYPIVDHAEARKAALAANAALR